MVMRDIEPAGDHTPAIKVAGQGGYGYFEFTTKGSFLSVDISRSQAEDICDALREWLDA